MIRCAWLLPVRKFIQKLDAEIYALASRPKWPSREWATVVQDVIDLHANNERLLLRTDCDVLPQEEHNGLALCFSRGRTPKRNVLMVFAIAITEVIQ